MKWQKLSVHYFETWNPEKAKENPSVQEHWEELNDGGNIIFCMNEILCTR